MRRRRAGPARRGIGDGSVAEGPRGRTVVNGQADWRLFTGDETALPGIAAMIESLPAGERAFAIVEVAGPDDEQPIETAAELEVLWLHRGGAPVAPSRALVGRWPTSICRTASARPA